MKLLIVDDSNIIRRVIENNLKDLPIELVGTASNGIEALRVLDATSPDLVTMDVTMPEMDGIACLEEMMQRRPRTRVLIVTALKDSDTGIKALRLGARNVLNKPFTGAKLREEILDMIESP
jgi:two-component system, chemotaxis family, chemotaxis protein CheY